MTVIIEAAGDAGRLASRNDDVMRKLRQVALVVPAIALLLSGAAMPRDARLGLFGAALILGWTQLVGL